MSVVIEVGHVNSTVNVSGKLLDGLKRMLRYENDIMSRRASDFRMPQYSYLINNDGVFFTGLLNDVVGYLSHYKVPFTIRDTRLIRDAPDIPLIQDRLDTMKYIDPPVNLRDIQMDVTIEGLSNTRGIISACTGFGKTVTLSALILAWELKTLILVDAKDLANQLMDEVEYFTGVKPGLIGDGKFDPQQITIGMVKTLTHPKSRNRHKIKEFLESIEYVVLDECHHVQATTWRKVLRSCKNASIVHGFTATAFASKVKGESGVNNSKDILLKAYIGPLIASVSTRDMIELGYLAEPTIKFVRNTVYFDGTPLDYGEEYQRILVRDEARNRSICKIASKAYRSGEQTIIFVTRLEHGELIASMLYDDFGVTEGDIAFVTGELEGSSRKDHLHDFKEGHLPILIGTVLSEGLNFFCNVGINAAAGDSDKNTIQRLGRILRKKKDPVLGDVDTKTPAFVTMYDFSDMGHPFFDKHSGSRLRCYKREGHEVVFINEEDL